MIAMAKNKTKNICVALLTLSFGANPKISIGIFRQAESESLFNVDM